MIFIEYRLHLYPNTDDLSYKTVYKNQYPSSIPKIGDGVMLPDDIPMRILDMIWHDSEYIVAWVEYLYAEQMRKENVRK